MGAEREEEEEEWRAGTITRRRPKAATGRSLGSGWAVPLVMRRASFRHPSHLRSTRSGPFPLSAIPTSPPIPVRPSVRRPPTAPALLRPGPPRRRALWPLARKQTKRGADKDRPRPRRPGDWPGRDGQDVIAPDLSSPKSPNRHPKPSPSGQSRVLPLPASASNSP